MQTRGQRTCQGTGQGPSGSHGSRGPSREQGRERALPGGPGLALQTSSPDCHPQRQWTLAASGLMWPAHPIFAMLLGMCCHAQDQSTALWTTAQTAAVVLSCVCNVAICCTTDSVTSRPCKAASFGTPQGDGMILAYMCMEFELRQLSARHALPGSAQRGSVLPGT